MFRLSVKAQRDMEGMSKVCCTTNGLLHYSFLACAPKADRMLERSTCSSDDDPGARNTPTCIALPSSRLGPPTDTCA